MYHVVPEGLGAVLRVGAGRHPEVESVGARKVVDLWCPPNLAALFIGWQVARVSQHGPVPITIIAEC